MQKMEELISRFDNAIGRNERMDSLNCTVGNKSYALQMKELEDNKYLFVLGNNRIFSVEVCSEEQDELLIKCNGKHCRVFLDEKGKRINAFYNGIFEEISFTANKKNLISNKQNKSGRDITAPMPGVVAKILVETGKSVKSGDEILILESMKVYNALTAGYDGRIQSIHVVESEKVVQGQTLVELVPLNDIDN